MNETLPLLSVLVLSYKHQDYIAECIQSIWEQDYPCVEIIVLDDGSNDNSYAIVNEMAIKSPFKIQVIRQENTGLPSLNFNRMAAVANGSLFAFIAADDKFCKNAFSRLIEKFIQNKNTQLVYSNGYKWISNQISESNLVHNATLVDLLQRQEPKLIYDYVTKYISPFFIQSIIVKKDVFLKIGGFDENLLADDWVFNIRLFEFLMKNNQQFSFVNTPLFCYRIHENNLHKNFDKMISLTCQVSDKYIHSKYRKKYVIAKVFSNAIVYYIKDNKLSLFLKFFFDKRNAKILCLFLIASRILNKIKTILGSRYE